jgi:hypothetical protein
LHSAATVLAFLQKERELLKPGYRFQPIIRDAVLRDFDAKKLMHSAQKIVPIPTTNVIIVPSDPEKKPIQRKRISPARLRRSQPA